MEKVVYDTNQLLDHPDLPLEGPCAVSFMTLRELDSLKRRPDLKFMAQQAIKGMKLALSEGLVEVIGAPTKETLNPESPDERIILDCLQAGFAFSTQDIGAQVIATAVGVPLVGVDMEDTYDKNYTGYVELQGDATYESEYHKLDELQKVEFEDIFKTSLKENQYCCIKRITGEDVVWVTKGNAVRRLSPSMKSYRNVGPKAKNNKTQGIVDDPLDAVQQAALHAIFDDSVPLTIIDGKLGTGKTMLSLMAALARTAGTVADRRYSSVCVTRPNITTDERFRRGFLPGTAEEKDAPWLAGITSNLKFLFEKTEKQVEEGIASSIFDDFFDIVAMETIQGLSLNGEILLVDEFQLLDRDGLLLVLSRIAGGSKVVLIGDTRNQTYHLNRGNEGFKILQSHYGNHHLVNFIRLDNIYRSPLAKFVAELMEEH